MGILLDLRNWRRLEEKEQKMGHSYFETDLFQVKNNIDKVTVLLIQKVKSLYPEAKVIDLYVIEIPLDDSSVTIDFWPYSDSAKNKIETTLGLPKILISSMDYLSVDHTSYAKNIKKYWIEAKPNYSNLSEEEFKSEVISTIKSKNNVIEGKQLDDEIRAFISISSLEYDLVPKQTVIELKYNLLFNEAVLASIKEIEKLTFRKTYFDFEKVSNDMTSYKNQIMIDYSKFTESELKAAAESILEKLEKYKEYLWLSWKNHEIPISRNYFNDSKTCFQVS